MEVLVAIAIGSDTLPFVLGRVSQPFFDFFVVVGRAESFDKAFFEFGPRPVVCRDPGAVQFVPSSGLADERKGNLSKLGSVGVPAIRNSDEQEIFQHWPGS